MAAMRRKRPLQTRAHLAFRMVLAALKQPFDVPNNAEARPVEPAIRCERSIGDGRAPGGRT
jgi:hypothetical protein